jgi:hypothetical protein
MNLLISCIGIGTTFLGRLTLWLKASRPLEWVLMIDDNIKLL